MPTIKELEASGSQCGVCAMRSKGLKIFLLLCVLAASTSVTRAQFSGNITGNVQDPSGADVPGATVTLTNLSTSENSATTSDSGGELSIRKLGSRKLQTGSYGQRVRNYNSFCNLADGAELESAGKTLGRYDQ